MDGEKLDRLVASHRDMPEAGYVGADSVTVEIIYPDGTARTRRYAIEVK
jgi:hypothetical protein